MSQLEEIKKGVEACRTYNFGMRYADKLAHEDAPKLVAALEVIQYIAAQHAARTPFPDADKESQWYSLGKQHAYERVILEIKEALQ